MIKLTFLGDVMCTGGMLDAFKCGNSFDFKSLFKSVKRMLSESDYVFANLETPISPTNSNLTNERYCFCSPIEFVEAAKDAGIDFVSTANNHCLDRGISGIDETVKALDSVGLKHTGIFTGDRDLLPSFITVKGLKVGVAAYTYGTLKWGGVNLISGTHEHVTHDGVYNCIGQNKLATYSLGNFNSMAGTFLPPYDQFSDYSVAWHVYVDEDTRKICKSTFSILKTLAMADGKIGVMVCNDLLNGNVVSGMRDEFDEKQLLCDMQTVAFRFTGSRFNVEDLSSSELPLIQA